MQIAGPQRQAVPVSHLLQSISSLVFQGGRRNAAEMLFKFLLQALGERGNPRKSAFCLGGVYPCLDPWEQFPYSLLGGAEKKMMKEGMNPVVFQLDIREMICECHSQFLSIGSCSGERQE